MKVSYLHVLSSTKYGTKFIIVPVDLTKFIRVRTGTQIPNLQYLQHALELDRLVKKTVQYLRAVGYLNLNLAQLENAVAQIGKGLLIQKLRSLNLVLVGGRIK